MTFKERCYWNNRKYGSFPVIKKMWIVIGAFLLGMVIPGIPGYAAIFFHKNIKDYVWRI